MGNRIKRQALPLLHMTTQTGTHKAVVRKAVASDSQGIAELVNAFTFRSDGSGQLIPLTTDDIFGSINKGLFYVAGQEGKVLACGSVVEYGGMAELRSLAVSRQHQGNGFGTALIQTCVREAKQRGYSALYTLTQQQNFALFENQGFEKSDIPPEKLSKDCAKCPAYDSCNETAFMKIL